MSRNKTIQEIISLREAAIDDLMSLSNEELRAEAQQDGKDLDAIAAETKNTMREAAAATLRLRMNVHKMKPATPGALQSRPTVIRPSLERMKQLVERVFASNPSAGLAFRQGKKQTDADWQTLYDDYVAMGAIKPDGEE